MLLKLVFRSLEACPTGMLVNLTLKICVALKPCMNNFQASSIRLGCLEISSYSISTRDRRDYICLTRLAALIVAQIAPRFLRM